LKAATLSRTAAKRSKKENIDRHVNLSIHDNPQKTVLSCPFPNSVIPAVFFPKPYISQLPKVDEANEA
jgi:hypothetical protein